MIMLIHRICMAFSGLGKFISVAKEMSVRAAILLQASRGREGVSGWYEAIYARRREEWAFIESLSLSPSDRPPWAHISENICLVINGERHLMLRSCLIR